MGSYETNAILKRLRSIKSTSYPSREGSVQTEIRLRPEDLVVNRCTAARSGDVNTSWLNVDFAEVRQAPTRIPYPHTTTDLTIADNGRHMPYPAPYRGSLRVPPNTQDTTIAERVREMAVSDSFLGSSPITPLQWSLARDGISNADFSTIEGQILSAIRNQQYLAPSMLNTPQTRQRIQESVQEQYLAPSMLNTPQTRQRIQESVQEQLREAAMLHLIPTADQYSVSVTGDVDSVRVSIATIPTPFRVDIPPGELTGRLVIDDTADCRGPDTQITDEW